MVGSFKGTSRPFSILGSSSWSDIVILAKGSKGGATERVGSDLVLRCGRNIEKNSSTDQLCQDFALIHLGIEVKQIPTSNIHSRTNNNRLGHSAWRRNCL